MKVRSSTRATSLGSERARKLFGRSLGLRRIKVPASTSRSHRALYSASEPAQNVDCLGFARRYGFGNPMFDPRTFDVGRELEVLAGLYSKGCPGIFRD